MKDLDRLIQTAADIGVDLRCFQNAMGGREARQRASERSRLFWALYEQGWTRGRIAKASGYHYKTVSHIMNRYVRPGATRIESVAAEAKIATRKVAQQHGLQEEDIWSRNQWGALNRHLKLTRARREVWSMLKLLGYSMPEIARATGCSGHSGVADATRTIPANFASGNATPTGYSLEPYDGCALKTG